MNIAWDISVQFEGKREIRVEVFDSAPAQLFSLACMGVVLHADVVGVEFVSRYVGEELREVQPPQELHWVGVGAVAHTAGGEPVVEREGEGQR